MVESWELRVNTEGTVTQLFLGWDLVVHIAEDFPRSVCHCFLSEKQVLAVEMDVLLVPGRVTFENGGGNGDVTSQLEAVPIAL